MNLYDEIVNMILELDQEAADLRVKANALEANADMLADLLYAYDEQLNEQAGQNEADLWSDLAKN